MPRPTVANSAVYVLDPLVCGATYPFILAQAHSLSLSVYLSIPLSLLLSFYIPLSFISFSLSNAGLYWHDKNSLCFAKAFLVIQVVEGGVGWGWSNLSVGMVGDGAQRMVLER